MAACCAAFVDRRKRHGLHDRCPAGPCRPLAQGRAVGQRDVLRHSERPGRGASRSGGVRRCAGPHHLWRAEGQDRALRGIPAADRHRARRRRHHPAPEPHRLSDRLLRARADRSGRQQGQSRLQGARARLHPALLRQPRSHLPRLLQGLRLHGHGAPAAPEHPGPDPRGRGRRGGGRRVESRARHRLDRPARARASRAHERGRDLPHGLYIGHDGQSQVRAALVQHHPAGRAPDQRRHGTHRARRAARLSAGVSQLGLSVPAAGDRQRQPCRAARALLGQRRRSSSSSASGSPTSPRRPLPSWRC